MRNNILFVLFISIVIIFLYLISGTKSPQIPMDDQHISVTTEQECLSCHGEGMVSPRKKDHPPKDQCFLCHKRSRKPVKR